MGFIGDAVGSVTRPILGKPDADMQEQGQQASLNATNAQMALANKLLAELEPLRRQVIARSTAFMGGGQPGIGGNAANLAANSITGLMTGGIGGLAQAAAGANQTSYNPYRFDPTASAMYAPMKGSTENQFNTARGNIMSQLPQGGALFESLANLEGQKAQSLSSMIAQIIADEYQKAYGMASGAPQTAGSIFAGGGQTGTSLLNALAQQQGVGQGTLNAGIGGASNIIAAILAG